MGQFGQTPLESLRLAQSHTVNSKLLEAIGERSLELSFQAQEASVTAGSDTCDR